MYDLKVWHASAIIPASCTGYITFSLKTYCTNTFPMLLRFYDLFGQIYHPELAETCHQLGGSIIMTALLNTNTFLLPMMSALDHTVIFPKIDFNGKDTF